MFKEAERARGPTNAEQVSLWAADERAGAASGVAASQISFKDALLRIVASETWTQKLEAATDALDVANGKVAGVSAHYGATMSEPTRDGRPGQPRGVVRIQYTVADGFKLYTFYANSGNTFEVKPTGSARETRPLRNAATRFGWTPQPCGSVPCRGDILLGWQVLPVPYFPSGCERRIIRV